MSLIDNNFLDTDYMHVPKVHWALTRKAVWFPERIDAVNIKQLTPADYPEIDFKLLAERGVEIFCAKFLKMVFFMQICIMAICC